MPKSLEKTMTKAAKSTKPTAHLSYEEALRELEEILTVLENEAQSLEESMRLFERGKDLLQHCQKLLNQAELRVRILEEETDEKKGE